MSNVLTWKAALDSGCEPRLYPYTAADVPMGQYEATLDFKVWSKNTMGISCYFTETANGKKFRLTVFRRKEDEQYVLENDSIDFKECAIDVAYLIAVTQNKMGNAVFKSASPVHP